MPLMSAAASGFFLLMLRGLLHTIQQSLGRELKAMEWPFFRLMAASCLLASVIIAAGMASVGIDLPERTTSRWVILRGLFGAASFVLSVVAAQVGAPLGDVEALRSMNMVAAALLGHFFLGEALKKQSLLAICLSVCGAALVSQPALLFGVSSTSESNVAWLGYITAPLSGLCQACVFACTRKAPTTSVWVQACSSHLAAAMVAGLLPLTPVLPDAELTALTSNPSMAMSLFLALFANTFLSTVTLSAASLWCTAAESAVVSTSASLTFGYAAQAAFYTAPNGLAVTGACLMLLGVVVMACASEQAAPVPVDEKLPTLLQAESLSGLAETSLLKDEEDRLPFWAQQAASDVSTADECTVYSYEDYEDEKVFMQRLSEVEEVGQP